MESSVLSATFRFPHPLPRVCFIKHPFPTAVSSLSGKINWHPLKAVVLSRSLVAACRAANSDMPSTSNVRIFSGSSNPKLSEEIAKEMGLCIESMETCSDIAGSDVILVQSTFAPFEDHSSELLSLITECRRKGSRNIILVIPYSGYSSLKKKLLERNSVSDAKIINELLISVGVSLVVSCEIPTTPYLKLPIHNVDAQFVILQYISRKPFSMEDFVVVSPHIGACDRAYTFALSCKAAMAVIEKVDYSDNNEAPIYLIGDVQGKTVIMFDDILDSETAVTMANGAALLREKGAKSVYGCDIHALLCHEAADKLSSTGLFDEVIVTNTMSMSKKVDFPHLTILSVAKIFADKIWLAHHMDGGFSV